MLQGEYFAVFDDGHTASVYSVPAVGDTRFGLHVHGGELVSDTCPDLETGRRYAECAHWLLHRAQEIRGLPLPTTLAEALKFVPCDLADLAFLLRQAEDITVLSLIRDFGN